MDESAGDVKYAEAGNPRNQQNHEQYCPNAHFSSSFGTPRQFRLMGEYSLTSAWPPVVTRHLVTPEKYICRAALALLRNSFPAMLLGQPWTQFGN